MRIAPVVVALASLFAVARAEAQSIQLVNVAPHISHVVAISHAGDGSGRLFFAQQFGRILIHQAGSTLPTPFLDISSLVRTTGPEEGLLGLAFDPAYESNGNFFVYYTNAGGNNVVARYHASPASNVADPASGVGALTLPHPLSERHNGGQLQFGPDGFLYVGTGDGGSLGDFFENAQNLGSLLGKILRIDVRSLPYVIPPGNPFAGVPGARPEIWAYGLRNPWRFSFDRATGDLFIADVGEHLVEEINFQPAGSPGGANYGWNDMEGSRCFDPPVGCLTAGRTLPIIEYQHYGSACSVIGGYLYRGSAVPGLVGNYVYADFCNTRLFVAHQFPDYWASLNASFPDVYNFSTFGEDESGELYVATLIYELKGPVIDGNVYRLTPGPLPPLGGGPSTVQETAGTAVAWAGVGYSNVPVTVDWTTVSGTATAGSDFVPASGSLTFPPWTSFSSVEVPLIDDSTDEDDQTFAVRFSNAQGAVIVQDSSQVTIVDDDPAPYMVGFGCGTPEGNSGTTPCRARVRLIGPSERAVTVGYASSGTGSATPNVDYQVVSGTVTFAPGVSEAIAPVPVIGDTVVEDSEFFGITLGPATNAQLLTTSVLGNITEDDVAVAAGRELGHGSTVTGDLAGGTADLYRLQVGPFEAYEVALDQRSGDAQGARLELVLGAAGVIAAGQPTGTGGALTARFVNSIEAVHGNLFVRVSHPSCGSCDAQDTYRLSVRETTLRAPRFNNRNGQASVLVLANTQAVALTAIAHFWSETGSYLGAILMPLPPRGTGALATSNEPLLQGQAGSVTITHGGPYGAVVGKIASVDPASGSAFDTPLEPRPH